MKQRRRLLTTAAVLSAMACINFSVFEAPMSSNLTLMQIWYLCLTLLLAAGLAFGKGWARWMIVILTVWIGSINAIFLIRIVLANNYVNANWTVILWAAALSLVYLFISCYLVFSAGVAREINRANFLK